jgi:hypothetical protein
MHPAVEDEPLTGGLEIIAIGADLGAAGEVGEFQEIEEMVLPPDKSKQQFPRSSCATAKWQGRRDAASAEVWHVNIN